MTLPPTPPSQPPHVEPPDPAKIRRVRYRVARAWRLAMVGMHLNFNTWEDNYTGEPVHLLVYPEPNIYHIDWYPYRPGDPMPFPINMDTIQ